MPDFLCDEDNISGFNTTMEDVIQGFVDVHQFIS
jgi:hypothetical protein